MKIVSLTTIDLLIMAKRMPKRKDIIENKKD